MDAFNSEVASDSRVVVNPMNQKEVRSIRALKWGDGYHLIMEVTRESRVTSATHLYPDDRDALKEQWDWAKAWLKDETNPARLIEGLHRPNRREEASKTERAKAGEKVEANAE